MALTSGGKAYFINEDGGGSFYLQFNPKELKLEDTASWKPSDEQGQAKPLLTYEKGQPAVLSMDVIFDTTDTGGSVDGRILALRAFLEASVSEADESGATSKRPPFVSFHWKDFSFRGVMEKISASMLMFKADGTPLRAKVSLTLKERAEPSTRGTGAGSSVTLTSAGSVFVGGGGAAKTVTTTSNQTMSQAAAANKSNMRELAQANPQIQDMMNVPAGTELVIPGSARLAEVLNNQARANSPCNIGVPSDIDPFGAEGARNGFNDIMGNIGAGGDLSTEFSTCGLGNSDNDRGNSTPSRETAPPPLATPPFVPPAAAPVADRARQVIGGNRSFDDLF